MKPVIKITLWQRRWSIFWWCLGLGGMIVLTIALYPSFKDQSALNQQLQDLPQAAKSLFSDTGDFFSPQGYLSSQLYYLMLPLLLSVMTIGLGSSLIAKEEDSGTIELLLARPISRGRLLLAKFMAGFVILAAVSTVVLIVTLVMAELTDMPVALASLAVATLLTAVVAWLFGSLAFAVTALGRSARKSSIGLAAFVALASYVVASLADIAGWLSWPAKFTAYHYFQPGEALYGNYHWPNLIGLALVIGILLFISWRSFRRRDLGV